MRATWGAALGSATLRLKQAGIESARLDARLLLAHALSVSTTHLFANPAASLSAEEEDRIETLLLRRLAREPMSHILGRREFWGLDFKVTPAVLDPRADTETLIEAALDLIPDRFQPLDILDLGTGSGCILLALLSELPQATGIGVDASPAALAVARENARLLSLDHRARFVEGCWGQGIEGVFDLILSNPPYIPDGAIDALEPEVARFEPRSALAGGADGLDCYRALIPDAVRLLAPNGALLLEVGQGQAGDVSALLTAAGLELFDVRDDLAGIARCVVAGRPEAG
ncbi:MAG: peptide chain release factor N(5)-glutamine methyltransferase [Rhodospirillaceae bacterium]|nr:peptide chain release factor N(5)-glutamine methyltransferase [Rhodospirillaceae bacterium]